MLLLWIIGLVVIGNLWVFDVISSKECYIVGDDIVINGNEEFCLW